MEIERWGDRKRRSQKDGEVKRWGDRKMGRVEKEGTRMMVR